MQQDYFSQYQQIAGLINQGDEVTARTEVITLLQKFKDNDLSEYPPVLNALIKAVGLYPYMHSDTSDWSDRLTYEAYKVDVGSDQLAVLHREQSFVLRQLLEGKNIIVSAPTSFGKSFIIDAFIATRCPTNVVIIVPTIALTDETRRRIQRKFGGKYNIITTTDNKLGEKNIFIFPQERVANYLDFVTDIDILIVDEFYKVDHLGRDEERSLVLIKAISDLRAKSKQCYFLAPNIEKLNDSLLAKDFKFLKIDFNTVYSEIYPLFENLSSENKEHEKEECLLSILGKEAQTKKIIYASSHSELNKLARIVNSSFGVHDFSSNLLSSFSDWIRKNYGPDYALSELIKNGVGVHNGRIHRSLAQIQIHLFEKPEGLKTLLTTSSLIEGVNTSAEVIVLWNNRLANSKLSSFEYRNIMGRAGRMFRYFVGRIYLLEEPPKLKETNLTYDLPEDSLLAFSDEVLQDNLEVSKYNEVVSKKLEICRLLGIKNYIELVGKLSAKTLRSEDKIHRIVNSIRKKPDLWRTFPSFNNVYKPGTWNKSLFYEILRIQSPRFHHGYSKLLDFTRVLVWNWDYSIPELLKRLDFTISVDDYFELEKFVSFNLCTMLSDAFVLYQLVSNTQEKIDYFLFRMRFAFLPKLVYELEEYGLPRMVSKKIQSTGLIDLTEDSQSLNEILEKLRLIGEENICSAGNFDDFDKHFIRYFYQGI